MAGAVTTTEISAAVSAATTAVVGTALNWGGRITAWMRAAVPDDHRALSASSRHLTSVESTTGLLRVLVVVAPSQRLRRDGFDPDAVTAVVARHVGWAFDAPAYSSLAQVRYAVRAGDPGQNVVRQLHFSRGGAVALDWSIEPAPAADGGTAGLPLLEFLRPLLMVLLLVSGPAYDGVYRRRWLRFRRRCDRFVAVSSSTRDDLRSGVRESGNTPKVQLNRSALPLVQGQRGLI